VTSEVESIVGPYHEAADVLDHAFDTKPWWWTSVVDTSVFDRLPESPSRGAPWKRIARSDLFEIAAAPASSDFDLLVACYAWGMGPSVGNLRRYRRPLRENSTTEIIERLGAARSVLTSEGPVAAYRSLGSAGRHKLVRLGPSFFTKFLYAADGMHVRPRGCALILDQFVAVALNDLRDRGIDTGQTRRLVRLAAWPAAVYETWLAFAHREAEGATTHERVVRADAVEMALFDYGYRLAMVQRIDR
jgi:hypothetical protein